MKKWMLTVAFVIALCGYASAQNSQTKVMVQKKEVMAKKKGVAKKTAAKKVNTQPVAAVAQQPVKMPILVQPVLETGGIPVAAKKN